MTDEEIIKALRETRSDYETECTWQRFLLDSATGTGGYAGRIVPPQHGYLGWAAEAYSNTLLYGSKGVVAKSCDTYLDRFPREDDPKFQRRRDIAHLENYVAPIGNLFLSYIGTAKNSVDNLPPAVAEWKSDVTGAGMTWHQQLEEVIYPRACWLGWCPVLFDRDSAPEGVSVATRAQEQQLGLRLRSIPLFPANVLDWELNEATQTLVWVKIRTFHKQRNNPLEPPLEYEEFRIFTADRFSVYRVVKHESNETLQRMQQDVPHNMGGVPLVSFRNKQTSEDPIRGVSMVGEIATAQRRHFNLTSELDEHIRTNVFPILGIPVKDVDAAITNGGSLMTGNGTALFIPMESSQQLQYVAPPASVAATLETRIAASVREMYRVMDAPYENDKGGAQSGEALAQKNEGTNRKVSNAVKSLASAEQTALRLVAKAIGAAQEGSVDALTVTPQKDFRVDDASVDIDNAIKAAGLPGMPALVIGLNNKRLAAKMLPNLPPDLQAQIDDAIDEATKRLEEQKAAPPIAAVPSIPDDDDDAQPPPAKAA